MTGRIEAVLFDLDGTLVATMDHWDRCWSDYAAHHGYSWSDTDRRNTHGHGDWARYLARVCGIGPPEQVAADCVELMVALVESGHIALLPGVRELLATATNRVATGVVSASPRRFVHAALDRFDLRKSLQVTVSHEDTTATKPDPAPWLHAAELLGVHPRTCVAVEDSAAGVRSAHTAGMRVLAIPNPHLHPSEANLPDYTAAAATDAAIWLRAALAATDPPAVRQTPHPPLRTTPRNATGSTAATGTTTRSATDRPAARRRPFPQDEAASDPNRRHRHGLDDGLS